MKMNKYQALKVHTSDVKKFIIVMNVVEFKRLIKTSDNVTRYKGRNQIVFNQNSEVDWIEVELELDTQFYYGCRFLKIPFEIPNESIRYNSNIDGLGDYDNVEIECTRED